MSNPTQYVGSSAKYQSPYSAYKNMTHAQWQELRKKNPSVFYRAEVQRQMLNDRIEQGAAFYGPIEKPKAKSRTKPADKDEPQGSGQSAFDDETYTQRFKEVLRDVKARNRELGHHEYGSHWDE